jgi:hypothetical protein
VCRSYFFFALLTCLLKVHSKKCCYILHQHINAQIATLSLILKSGSEQCLKRASLSAFLVKFFF